MSSTANSLVSIPDCKASQLLANVEKELGHGELLAIADPSSPQTVLIQVGHAAFALKPDDRSSFYTHADDERLYFFSADHLGSGSYVKLQLPADVSQAGSPTQKLRDQFEDALLLRGFLRAGPLAAADELGRSIAHDSKQNAAALSSTARDHIESSEGSFVHVPEGAKDSAVTSKDATGQAAQWATAASTAVSDTLQSAGAKVGQSVPEISLSDDSPIKQTYQKVAEGASAVGSGISTGASELSQTASQAAHDVIKHDYGADASRTASNAKEALANAGTVAGEAVANTSGYYHGAQVGTGVVKGNQAPSE